MTASLAVVAFCEGSNPDFIDFFIANEIQPSAYGLDEELQEKLWTFTENLVKEKLH